MFQSIVNLGVMNLVKGPMIAKMLPKQALAGVVKKIANHYLASGHHLQEAMLSATQQAFGTLSYALNTTFIKGVSASKKRKEFSETLEKEYLIAFFAQYPNIDEKKFREQAAHYCNQAAKLSELLVIQVATDENDVERFFTEGELDRLNQTMNLAEAEFTQILSNELPDKAYKKEFLLLMEFNHLLFQAIYYFFRQELSNTPEAKAMLDEIRQLNIENYLRNAQGYYQQMQQQLLSIENKLQNYSNNPALLNELQTQKEDLQDWLKENNVATLKAIQEKWHDTEKKLDDFEERLGEKIERSKGEIVEEVRSSQKALSEQLDEIQKVLSSLGKNMIPDHLTQTAIPLTNSLLLSQQKEVFHNLGISLEDRNKALKEEAAHKSLLFFKESGILKRTITIFFDTNISVGRHSKNDLVLYWFPLPSPTHKENPEWLNWRHTGKSHPTINLSRKHLNLRWLGDGVAIKDISSKGTSINGKLIPKARWIPIEDGDTLSLAQTLHLSFRLLKNRKGQPIGWHLKRLENEPEREEFFFLADGAEITFGNSPTDNVQLEKLAPHHFSVIRKNDELFLFAKSPLNIIDTTNKKLDNTSALLKNGLLFKGNSWSILHSKN